MKFVTFNIRYENDQDGINCFVHRAGGILRKIEAEMPDVIGFQECLPSQFDFLRRHLADYSVVGCGRTADYAGEHSCIAFIREKYELIGLDTEWLSPTPFVPGSRFPDQYPHPRIVTCAVLRPYGSDTPFRVYNTHLDNASASARELGAQHIANLIGRHLKRQEMPLVLMGDFNDVPDSAPIRTLLGDRAIALTDHTSGIEYSFHDYGRGTRQKIDYIFSRGMKATGPARTWDDVDNGIYLSDHYPLTIELDLEK